MPIELPHSGTERSVEMWDRRNARVCAPASASEIVAGALQDHRRAIIIGEQSAGAANPGRPYPINDQFEVVVPNGQLLSSISRKNWEGSGVTPDVRVDAADALETARTVARREGVLAGISAGAALWAAIEVATRDDAPHRIAVVLPDSGERYVSTPFFAPEAPATLRA